MLRIYDYEYSYYHNFNSIASFNPQHVHIAESQKRLAILLNKYILLVNILSKE